MNPPAAPTLAQMLTVPVILDELEAAWRDSLTADPVRRHEEGGWIYFDPTNGEYQVRRAGAGGQSYLDLDNPPELGGYFLVGTYHTHPNPSSEGWQTGPSDADTESAHLLGVPCIIRADDGLHTTGPPSRRGGLTGNPGYPD